MADNIGKVIVSTELRRSIGGTKLGLLAVGQPVAWDWGKEGYFHLTYPEEGWYPSAYIDQGASGEPEPEPTGAGFSIDVSTDPTSQHVTRVIITEFYPDGSMKQIEFEPKDD